MKDQKHQFMTTIMLVLFCLNIFCLSNICAYDDVTASNSAISSVSDSDNSLNDGDECCAMCDGHSCLSHYSFICNASLSTFSLQKINKYMQPKELFLSSVVLQSIPKPPCLYSLV